MDRNFEHIFELILLRNIQEKFKLNFPLAEKQKMMVQCKFKKLSVDEKKILESFIESKNKDILKRALKEEILHRYYYQDGIYKHNIKNDLFIREAVNLLDNQDKYREILSKN